MPRDKYVHLSNGRKLKVYRNTDGSEYYKDDGEKKTLRSNQKTMFKDSAKAEEAKARPVNVAVRRVSALPSSGGAEFVQLSNNRQLKLYTRDDGTKYYNDGGRKNLRSNQHIAQETSKEDPKKEPPPLKQASKTAQVKPTGSSSAPVGRVPPKAPKRCPFSKDGKHAVSVRTFDGRFSRSTTAKNEFLASKGLVIQPGDKDVDHVIPLWDGGADCPCNMQLLSKEKHKEKTAKEATERANRARLHSAHGTF